MQYKVINLFAGIGGMSKAFFEIGAEIVWANEDDKHACILYEENFGDDCFFKSNITDVSLEQIPDFDIIVSNVPCQSFSSKSYQGWNQGNYLNEVLKFIIKKECRAFLLEYPKALLNIGRGQAFKEIIEELNCNGFQVNWAILNLKEYGNIPHSRERLYIVGFKSNSISNQFYFPEPLALDTSIQNILDFKDRKDDIYYCNKKLHKVDLSVIEASKSWGFILRSKELHPVNGDICPALTSYSDSLLIRDNYGVRKLTPIEYLKLHGFIDYKLLDSIPTRQLYSLIRSSSSVPVIKRIGKNMIDVLDSKESINQEFDVLIRTIETEENNSKKGKALEILIKKFFEQVDGFEDVDTNIRTKTEEIDISITNVSKDEFWRKEGLFIIAECKNWSGKSGKSELVLFRSKFNGRRGRVKLGFFISWNGFTTTFHDEDLRGSTSEQLIIPIDGTQIKAALNSGDVEYYIKKWYREAVMS